MADNEHIEDLGGGVYAYVNNQHSFGTDSFLLSHFAAPRQKETTCDLGCGCGIVPLLWFRAQNAPEEVFALEIQPKAVELARRSVEESELTDKIRTLEGDLRSPPAELSRDGFDLITCNPPYNKLGTGVMSSALSNQISRHETTCTLDDVCAAAAQLLRFGGRICLCQLPERLPDVFQAMRTHRIEPKRLRFVQEVASKAPWLVLVEGKLGAKPFLQVERPLLLWENGDNSKEMLDIFYLHSKDTV